MTRWMYIRTIFPLFDDSLVKFSNENFIFC